MKALEIKEKAAIFMTAVCIGDSFATNFELLFTPEYYKATMYTYQLTKTFLQNNQEYTHIYKC